MDDIHTKRTTYKADLAVLIINNGSYCGLASAILADANSAFAAVYWDCATGYFSFAHEIGHLQGARHDPGADASDNPYIYGHGYVNKAAGWRTIMAYNDPTCPGGSCTRIQHWSNPDVAYSGAATGTESHNFNALVLTRTRGIIAGFK
jgi:peptidyl-Asp metalloendopeptidase